MFYLSKYTRYQINCQQKSKNINVKKAMSCKPTQTNKNKEVFIILNIVYYIVVT